MRTAAALLFACLAVPAGAQSLMPGPNAAGRYEMQPVEGGIARLDTVTGEVSLCRIETGTMSCRPSEEDRQRLEARIRELSGNGAPSPAAGPPAPKAGPDAATAGDDAEIDKAIGRMKRVFRAFHDIAREFDGRDGTSVPDESAPNRT